MQGIHPTLKDGASSSQAVDCELKGRLIAIVPGASGWCSICDSGTKGLGSHHHFLCWTLGCLGQCKPAPVSCGRIKHSNPHTGP